jgi:hypothetical protein
MSSPVITAAGRRRSMPPNVITRDHGGRQEAIDAASGIIAAGA